jgi:hypothetical protein
MAKSKDGYFFSHFFVYNWGGLYEEKINDVSMIEYVLNFVR